MKPPVFSYASPRSEQAVLSLLADQEREVKVIAGGQSLVPLLNLRLARPEVLVDIAGVEELNVIRENGTHLTIGAGVTQADAEASDLVRRRAPLLHLAIGHIAHPQIRNRGTVCGSIAHHDPSAELPAAVLALDGVLRVRSLRGERLIAAADFFTFPFCTALEPDELLAEVQVPLATAGEGSAFHEMRRRRGDFAAVALATRVEVSPVSGAVARAALAFAGVAGTPVRAASAERSLVGNRVDEGVARRVAALAAAELHPPDDVHATGLFRREAAEELVVTTLMEAWRKAVDGSAD